MSAEPAAGLALAGEIVGAAVRDGGVPGAVAAIGRGPVTLAGWVAGRADTTPATGRPMTAGTLFDLASLTKVVATTTAVLALAGRRRLGLDDPAARYLPGFTALRDGPVTIRHLLAHTSGLPDTRKFYQWCSTRDELLRDLFATPLEAPPGTRVAYSDLGFLALGEIVAAVAGQPLDAVVRGLVTGPLGMTSTGYTPGAAPDRFAATERREDGTPWTGVVHDENARLMGGVAGHAGLFSVAADLAAFCAWWVSAADAPVPAALRREAESCQTAGLAARGNGGREPPVRGKGCRGLGWVRGGDRFDILGGHWPASAVSHTGFTGTSLALDYPSGVWTVLLTNSVHFGRDATAVKALRLDFHAAVAAACFR
ncbi:MAG TPA: serine hydrolase domain-containing protein [Trebonia sp.]|jgi:CubicO group peptidase (beta-lactamase class C family)|nr:serine hydrolase domain-containing protein [Trebonia sp.]